MHAWMTGPCLDWSVLVEHGAAAEIALLLAGHLQVAHLRAGWPEALLALHLRALGCHAAAVLAQLLVCILTVTCTAAWPLLHELCWLLSTACLPAPAQRHEAKCLPSAVPAQCRTGDRTQVLTWSGRVVLLCTLKQERLPSAHATSVHPAP